MDRRLNPDGPPDSGQVSREGRTPSTPHAGKGTRIPPPGSAVPADYLFLTRPMILIPVWTFFLLGAHHGSHAAGTSVDTMDLLTGLLSFTMLLGSIYIVNQIVDRRTDLENEKLFIVSCSIVKLPAAWTEAVLLAALSLTIGFILLPPPFGVITLISLVLGLAYSIEPVRLKRRAVADVMANAIGNGILNTLAGWISAGAPLSGWHILIPYPLAVASVHLATTLADIEGDSGSGLRTSGVVLGHRAGLVVSVFMMAAAAIAALIVGNNPAFLASLLSTPLFIIPARSYAGRFSPRAILFPVKAATAVFSAAACFMFPLYLPFVAIVIVSTRIYYKRRFNMTYPGL